MQSLKEGMIAVIRAMIPLAQQNGSDTSELEQALFKLTGGQSCPECGNETEELTSSGMTYRKCFGCGNIYLGEFE